MRALVGVAVVLVTVVIGGGLFVYSGSYNVAATDAHTGLTRWVFSTAMQRSVRTRASSVDAPAQFAEQQIKAGFSDYDEMCVTCHGAPGKERGEIGKGLNPMPPDLARAVDHWSNAELFWIVKNGVKMTGMPAFGPTHSEDRLWSIVAFVRQLPRVSPEQYEKFEGSADGSHDHTQHGQEPTHKH